MINLLPPKQAEEIKKEENFKLTIILGIIFLSFLISLSLILFAVKISIFSELESQKICFESREKELKSPEIKVLEEKVKKYNSAFAEIVYFYQNEPVLTEILKEISGTLPKGTSLTVLSIVSKGEKEERQMDCSLSGYCLDRETLLEFKKNLEEAKVFKEVYFPPSNWVKPTDIDFVVTFKIVQ